MRRILIVVIIILLSSASQALGDVAALSYQDPDGAVQTVAPSKQYCRVSGAMDIYLTAGLDRKVGFVLTDGNGQTIAEGVSDLITPSDTFTVLGQTYYGKVMTVPSSLAEGSYTLTAQILTSAGGVVASQSYPLVVDRTPPTAGEWWRYQSWNTKSLGDGGLVTGTYAYQIWLKGVNDSTGVTAVQFESYNPDTGEVLTSKSGWYNDATKEAGIGAMSGSGLVSSGALLAQDGPLGLRFILTDKAGNRALYSKLIKFDGTRNPLPELVAVHNPNVTTEFIPGSGLIGYEPYSAGMTVYENPMKFLYRLHRSNWRTVNPDYGVYICARPKWTQGAQEPPVVYQDHDYVYFDVTVPHSSINYYELWTLTNSTNYTNGLGFNVKMSSTATQSPKWVGMQYYRTDTGWTQEYANGGHFFFNNTSSTEITQMKVRVEARPYEQIFDCGIARCTIPPGGTECTGPVSVHKPAPGKWGGASVNHSLYNADGPLYTLGGWTAIIYDFQPPQITSFDIDRAAQKVTYTVYSYPDGWNGYNLLPGYWLAAVDAQTGQQVNINGTKTVTDNDNRKITVDYSSLADGAWQFTANAQDNAGNVGSLDLAQIVLDRTPPTVQFFKEGSVISDHDPTDSLGKVSFKVTDNVDQAPRVESIRLTGGPENADVYLAYHEHDGSYILEYPVLYPSAGQDYVLAVTVKDASGNRQTHNLSFSYVPPSVVLESNGSTTLNLPALPAPIVHADGSNALVSQPILVNGFPLGGTYDLTIIANAESTTPIVVNGVTLAPGEMTTVTAYDFAANGGRLNLPLWSEQAGQVGLVITSMAPNFPVLTAQMKFWQPAVELTADPGWAVQPLIETQKIGARALGVPCQVTFDENEAKNSDPLDSPKCLIEFTQKPTDYQVKDGRLQGLLGPDDPLTLSYQVSIFNGGQKYVIGSGSQALHRKPLTAVSVDLAASPGLTAHRKVEPVQLTAQSDGAVPCRVTDSEVEAKRWAAKDVACVVRWTSIPNGLEAAKQTRGPCLVGKMQDSGEQTVAWSVDVHSPLGSIANVQSRSLQLTVVDPPVPDLDIQPSSYSTRLSDAVFATSALADGQFGKAIIKSVLSDANLTIDLIGGVEGTRSKQYSITNGFSAAQYCAAGPLRVWETRTMRARLYYTDYPDISAIKDITVIGVPQPKIKAVLTGTDQALTTVGMPVRLQLGQSESDGFTYDAQRDGEWQVRIVSLGRKGKDELVADYQALPADGILDTVIEVPSDVATVKLQAIADLVSPENVSSYGYTQQIKSNIVYAVILKGEAPDGALTARRVSGPAPLTALLRLQTASADRRVMGDITWQMSSDGGATWTDIDNAAGYNASVTVNSGTYLVRARLRNKYSDAASYTENVELFAFDAPALAVHAPQSVLLNTQATLTACYTIGGRPVPDNEVVIEWSDRAKQLIATGPVLEITPADINSLVYHVRARPAAASETDSDAWLKQTVSLRVVAPAPPSCMIKGPGYLEYNNLIPQTYHFTADIRLPSGLDPEMYQVQGEWQLPNGNTASGLELDYTPTAEDAASRRIELLFTTWIEGFKEQTRNSLARSVIVGNYEWPEFNIEAKSVYPIAPSRVTLTAMPSTNQPWKLENPEYTWRLPTDLRLIKLQDRGRIAIVECNEAGEYEVSVDVTDARGATATASGTLQLIAPEPFSVAFEPLFSNREMREPLNVLMRPRVTGGHPNDRLVTYEYSVDDAAATILGSSSSGLIKGLTAGNKTVHLQALSKFDKVLSTEYTFEVLANQPPICKIEASKIGDYTYYTASCSDSDGKIISYRWYLDDKSISCGQRIRRGKNDPVGVLSFEAVDDAGGVFSTTVQ